MRYWPHLQKQANTKAYLLLLKRVFDPKWLQMTLARIYRLIAISEYTRQRLIEWVGSSANISVIRPALSPGLEINLVHETDRSGSEFSLMSVPSEIRLLTICRLVERKGVQTVLHAIHTLRREMPNMSYDIVDDGPYRQTLEKLVNKLGIRETVRFWGSIEDHNRNELLANCDIFVMVPFEDQQGDVEGFGIVYLEAGLHREPVIGSYSGGVSDVVKNNETGILVMPEDYESLANVLKSLEANSQEKARLGKNGYFWARQHFSSVVGKEFFMALEFVRE